MSISFGEVLLFLFRRVEAVDNGFMLYVNVLQAELQQSKRVQPFGTASTASASQLRVLRLLQWRQLCDRRPAAGSIGGCSWCDTFAACLCMALRRKPVDMFSAHVHPHSALRAQTLRGLACQSTMRLHRPSTPPPSPNEGSSSGFGDRGVS
ncbi:hypothetical protein DFH27DRAFT_629330 [Peziza echinospora]|nr:hypothetical protein DFH27DRAFT_629330 [Peziza echinospora]